MSTSIGSKLERALGRIQDTADQGASIYTHVHAEEARLQAKAADARLRNGKTIGPLDGRLVSIKGLFDVAGEVTHAGSAMLRRRPPATRDSTVVSRLRASGAIIVGRTQMTELAFSGLGPNGHDGIIANPADPERVTGGSSSGAAASVAAGMAEIAIGSDTGGSVRIPAALCGLVGFKPSHGHIPLDGAFPLSWTLDCAGPIGMNIADCADAYAVLAASRVELKPPAPARISLTRLGGRVTQNLEPAVAEAFALALGRMEAAGFSLSEGDMEQEFVALDGLDALGTFTVPELMAALTEEGFEALGHVDPMIRERIEQRRGLSAVDYIRLGRRRRALVERMDDRMQGGEILVLPTVPVTAPRLGDLTTPAGWHAANAAVMRNVRAANLLDLPSISLPLPSVGPPVGLMLMGRRGEDCHLLNIAATVEAVLSRR